MTVFSKQRFSRRILLLLALVAAGSTFGAEPGAANTIEITFSDRTIHASGISRGGDAIIFASIIGRHSGLQKLGRYREVVGDSDGDGEVTLTVPDLPVVSLWAVVDFTTGAHAVAAPPGFDPHPMELPAHGWRGGLEHFDLRRDYLEVLVVRPGAGAWMLSAAEGGSNDDDRALNAVLRTRLTRMQRLHGDAAPRPPVVVPRDLLLIVDPHTLDFFVGEAQ